MCRCGNVSDETDPIIMLATRWYPLPVLICQSEMITAILYFHSYLHNSLNTIINHMSNTFIIECEMGDMSIMNIYDVTNIQMKLKE